MNTSHNKNEVIQNEEQSVQASFTNDYLTGAYLQVDPVYYYTQIQHQFCSMTLDPPLAFQPKH
jgi:hypothetical protein